MLSKPVFTTIFACLVAFGHQKPLDSQWTRRLDYAKTQQKTVAGFISCSNIEHLDIPDAAQLTVAAKHFVKNLHELADTLNTAISLAPKSDETYRNYLTKSSQQVEKIASSVQKGVEVVAQQRQLAETIKKGAKDLLQAVKLVTYALKENDQNKGESNQILAKFVENFLYTVELLNLQLSFAVGKSTLDSSIPQMVEQCKNVLQSISYRVASVKEGLVTDIHRLKTAMQKTSRQLANWPKNDLVQNSLDRLANDLLPSPGTELKELLHTGTEKFLAEVAKLASVDKDDRGVVEEIVLDALAEVNVIGVDLMILAKMSMGDITNELPQIEKVIDMLTA